MRVHGVDFTSAPRRSKPITIASARLDASQLMLECVASLTTFAEFDQWLRRSGPWVAGFDFPFGLSRELLQALAWPHASWADTIQHLQRFTRDELVAIFRAWCDARPVGGKFAHRECDRFAGSSPSMKWVNPPVAFMLHEGAPRLLAAGLEIPLLHAGDPERVALEAYPGHLARNVLGNVSYKSDSLAKATPERRERRAHIVRVLEAGQTLLGLPVRFDSALRERCIEESSADQLDAVLCAVQAAWGWQRRSEHFGLPPGVDAIEGWIVGVTRESVRKAPAR